MVERVVGSTGTSKSVENVLVGCKLPNGVVLQNYEMKDVMEMTPQGSRTVKAAVKKGAPITLKGVAMRFGQVPEFQMSNGYALTPVPAPFWVEWLAANRDSDLVQNKLVFGADDLPDAVAMSRDFRAAKVKSGMEPIDPRNPPSVGGGLKVTPAAEQTA